MRTGDDANFPAVSLDRDEEDEALCNYYVWDLPIGSLLKFDHGIPVMFGIC
jgi:hypothetical protein